MDQLDAEAAEPSAGLTIGAVRGRAIGKFVLGFALLFGLFCIPMAFIGSGYARSFCALGNALLPDPAAAQRLAFRLDPAPDPEHPAENRPWEAVLTVRDLSAGTRVVMPLETMSLTYLPVATFLALALATPIKDRRREILILVPGFLLITLMCLLLVALSVIAILDDLSPIRVVNLGPRQLSFLGIVFRALMSPGMTYAVPGLLWWLLVRITRPAQNPVTAGAAS